MFHFIGADVEAGVPGSSCEGVEVGDEFGVCRSNSSGSPGNAASMVFCRSLARAGSASPENDRMDGNRSGCRVPIWSAQVPPKENPPMAHWRWLVSTARVELIQAGTSRER
jgi:hypothetical protein